MSPDGKWLACTERFNAYVAPFAATGRRSSSARNKALPMATVVARRRQRTCTGPATRPTLHWSLGARAVHAARSDDAFAFLAGAPESCPSRPTTGIDIGFDGRRATCPRARIALVGGRIVTMDSGDEVIEDGDGRRRGQPHRRRRPPRRGDRCPPARAVIDVTGKTIIPGLVDVHCARRRRARRHRSPSRTGPNYANLAFGVTTIHDPSNDTDEIFTAAEMARAGQLVAPRIFSTGTILYGAEGDFKAEIDSSRRRALATCGA